MLSFSNILVHVTRCSGVRFPLGFWLFACFQAQSADSFGETAPSVSGHVFSLKPWVVFLTTLTCLGMSCQSLFVPVPFEKTVIISVMVCIGGMKLWKILSFFSGQKV